MSCCAGPICIRVDNSMNLKLIKDYGQELKAGQNISSLGQVQKQMLFELGYAILAKPEPKEENTKEETNNEEDKVQPE